MEYFKNFHLEQNRNKVLLLTRVQALRYGGGVHEIAAAEPARDVLVYIHQFDRFVAVHIVGGMIHLSSLVSLEHLQEEDDARWLGAFPTEKEIDVAPHAFAKITSRRRNNNGNSNGATCLGNGPAKNSLDLSRVVTC